MNQEQLDGLRPALVRVEAAAKWATARLEIRHVGCIEEGEQIIEHEVDVDPGARCARCDGRVEA